MLKPLGHRVLILPDEQPETSESGLIQLPQDRDHVSCSGTVVAVGNGSKTLWDARQKAVDRAAQVVESWFGHAPACAGIVAAVRDTLGREPLPSVRVGDRVVLPVEA